MPNQQYLRTLVKKCLLQSKVVTAEGRMGSRAWCFHEIWNICPSDIYDWGWELISLFPHWVIQFLFSLVLEVNLPVYLYTPDMYCNSNLSPFWEMYLVLWVSVKSQWMVNEGFWGCGINTPVCFHIVSIRLSDLSNTVYVNSSSRFVFLLVIVRNSFITRKWINYFFHDVVIWFIKVIWFESNTSHQLGFSIYFKHLPKSFFQNKCFLWGIHTRYLACFLNVFRDIFLLQLSGWNVKSPVGISLNFMPLLPPFRKPPVFKRSKRAPLWKGADIASQVDKDHNHVKKLEEFLSSLH